MATEPSLQITAANVQKAYIAYFNRPADAAGMLFWTNASASLTMVDVMNNFAKSAEFNSVYPDSNNEYALVNSIYMNLFGRPAEEEGAKYWVTALQSGSAKIGDVAFNVARGAQGADLDALDAKVAYATAFTTALAANPTAAAAYNSNIAIVRGVIKDIDTAAEATTAVGGIAALLASISNPASAGTTFTLADSSVENPDLGLLKTMHISGDQDVRIDMSSTARQITGLDLDGNGVIANDGKENSLTVKPASGFVAVDAYARLDNGVLNETNLSKVFLGDIKYDGTGFQADGVSTDGNIVLGGLGADTVLGGLGNDFLAGGGVAQSRIANAFAQFLANGGRAADFNPSSITDSLSGGRNADFFFAELSLLSSTDGNNLIIDGGTTADNTSAGSAQSAQDSDWLLLQASDDDEPVTIVLEDSLADGNGDGNFDNEGVIDTRAGQRASMRDVENLDASGNTYAFIKGLSTTIGGAPVNGQNNGIGSSAQLNVSTEAGSQAANIIIGGYDNDVINSGAGNDIVMGGNLKSYLIDGVAVAQQLLDPNLVGLVGNNNGRDELTGGTGNDQMVFEADGGIIEGGATQNVDDTGIDTLWLTETALGAAATATGVTPVTATDLTSDAEHVLRFDLAAGKSGGLANASGYGGADLNAATGGYTADQTLYSTAKAALRVQVQDMENVIATGLGSIDFKAAGANSATDVTFANQQNFQAYNGNLDLRGTYSNSGASSTVDSAGIPVGAALDPTAAAITVSPDGSVTTTVTPWKAAGGAVVGTRTVTTTAADTGVNTLYASMGNDKLEGRTGGTTTFDATGAIVATTGDNRDKLSGGLGNDDFIFNLQVYGGDGVDVIHRQVDANNDNIWDGTFGRDFGLGNASTVLNAKLTLTVPSNDLLSLVEAVQFVNGGVTYKMSGLASTTYEGFVTNLNNALKADAGTANNVAVLNADKSVTITDPDGSAFALSTQGWFFVNGGIPPNGTADWKQVIGQPEALKIQDRIIFQAYEDRADGEKVDDGSTTGSSISLGQDAYAQDLVVDFRNGSTWLAEDQNYVLTFTNLTTEDKVALNVNGVTYTLTVGVDLDGNEIAGEELTTQGGTAASLAAIQTAFLARMAGFVTSFMDDDTAAGKVLATATATTLTLTQVAYNGEETVFMRTPTVTLTNGSGGEPATVRGLNNAGSEIQLLDFDGRNGELNYSNVLFLGNTDINRSMLQTALVVEGGTITGTEALVIDGGNNTLQATVFGTTTAIADNTATNSFLRTDFTVHGDDLLITAAGSDVINGGTGDDRVLGSLGTDTIDGGKSFYAVKVLGEAQARVYVLNQWEATNPTLVASLTAITTAGNVISSINRIGDAVTGNATPTSVGLTEVFNDTLQFQQSDFSANTNFTVVLNGFTGTTGANVAFPNAGAGQVFVDDAGNGTADGTTTFSNFENIRTVSGTGNAVANDGQGNDTLDISALSTATGGVSYDLTNQAVAAPTSTAGDVRYSKNADTTDGGGDSATLLFPDENDFETLVIKVDGVESVIAGSGNDLLLIDETEAAKNNLFNAGLGLDRVEYRNDYNTLAVRDENNSGGVDAADDLIAEDYSEPTVTITLDNVAAVPTATSGTDTVTMTGGRVGASVTAVDSLIAVERIALNNNTAQGQSESDTIDVKAMTGGATVDYTNGQVRDAAAVVHVTVENLFEIEKVVGNGGNDTVLVANSPVLAANARADELNPLAFPAKDISFATWYDFDEANATNTARLSFLSQSTAQIIDVSNENEYQFDLGAQGSDTVDYSAELNTITAAINFNNTNSTQRVVVDGNQNYGTAFGVPGSVPPTLLSNGSSRVDLLTNVENIVAAKGTSIIDVTSSTKNIKIEYSAGYTVGANLNTATDTETRTVVISEYVTSGVGGELGNIKLVEKIDNNGNVAVPAFQNAAWDRIEGGDMGERVYLTAAESRDVHTMNLRGGDNLVSYQGMGSNTIVAATVSVTPAVAGPTLADLFSGLVTVSVTTQDADPLTATTTDQITSYTQDNKVKAGTLELWGGGFGNDTITFAGGTDAYYKMGVLRNGSSWTDVWSTSNLSGMPSLSLTAFERFADDTTNDVYDLQNIQNVLLTFLNGFQDSGADDHDTAKVGSDAIGFNLSGVNTVDLDNLSATVSGFNFDFDVLDITNIGGAALAALTTVNGGTNALPVIDGDVTDEVVFGALGGVTNVNDFEGVVMTEATVLANGVSYVLNTQTNTLVVGGKTLTFNNDVNNLSFGGLLSEGTYNVASTLAATTGVTVSVAGTSAEAVTLQGGKGADVLTGGAGADNLGGGSGNDVLDGGFDPQKNEVHTYTISDPAGGAGETITIDGFTVTEGATIRGLVVANNSANAIGSAFVREWQANQASFTNATNLESVSYDQGSQTLTFKFTSAAGDVADNILGAAAGTAAASVSAETVFTPFTVRAESSDTYFFEATGALNGADTLNNVDASDRLDFSAFTGGGNVVQAAGNLGGAFLGAGLTVAGITDVVTAFNKGTLSIADVSGVASAGKFGVADNEGVVIAVTADADGVADASFNPWNLYYVSNGATAGDADLTVTLVGTVNSSAAELTPADIAAMI